MNPSLSTNTALGIVSITDHIELVINYLKNRIVPRLLLIIADRDDALLAAAGLDDYQRLVGDWLAGEIDAAMEEAP